jgi:hypothetical protein
VLDPAIYAVRDDLADVDLADRVFAPHYAQALAYRVTALATAFAKPDSETARITSLKIGDVIDVFDLSAGWAWVRTTKGIGYVRADCIESA